MRMVHSFIDAMPILLKLEMLNLAMREADYFGEVSARSFGVVLFHRFGFFIQI